MAAVSETIVREFFELHGFLIRQHRKFIAPLSEDGFDFIAINPEPAPLVQPLPFVLGSEDMARISRCVVVVKGWHTETFSPAVLAQAPEIFRSLEPEVLRRAAAALGEDCTRILVVPALPHGEEARLQSIELLRAKGINAVIPFRTLLADLIARTATNRNYQKSDLLQIIRILKNYDFFKEAQLELFKPAPGRKKRR